MAPRTIFANLPDGLQPFSLWDQSLADMGSLGVIPCTAAGANAIGLTPIASVNAPNVTTLQALQTFSFVAAASSTASVTANVNSLGAKNVYKADGATQVTSGDIVSGSCYRLIYSSALNSSAGGFYLEAALSGPGGWSNARLAKSANYTVANADKGSTIALGGAAVFTLTVSAASGYDSNFAVMIANEDTRGKLIAINGYTSFILWPQQSFLLFNQNNVWQFEPPGRWRITSGTSWNVDHVNGVNAGDGLGTGAGAFNTIQYALGVIQGQVDGNNLSLAIIVAPGTFTESVSLLGQTALGGTLSISIVGSPGTPANTVWQVPAGSTGLNVRDLAVIILDGFKFVALGAGSVAMTASQYAVIDFYDIEFGAFPGGNHIVAAPMGAVNYNGGSYTVSGNMANHIAQSGPSFVSVYNATVSIPNALTFTNWLSASGSGAFSQTLGTTFTGTGAGAGSTGTQYNLLGGASLQLNGIVLPGATAGTGGTVATVKKQIFTASGTYTPSAGMLYAVIECVGGGGSGAGGTGPATGFFVGGGGGSGSYSRTIASAATIGVSQVVTVGAAGVAPAAGNTNGGAGSDVSVGALCIGKGGGGGQFASTGQVGAGGVGGVAGTGDFTIAGNAGQSGMFAQVANIIFSSGAGASSYFGGGAAAVGQAGAGTTSPGAAAGNYGGGGSGGNANSTTGTFAGGNASKGVVVITEFCSQ